MEYKFVRWKLYIIPNIIIPRKIIYNIFFKKKVGKIYKLIDLLVSHIHYSENAIVQGNIIIYYVI